MNNADNFSRIIAESRGFSNKHKSAFKSKKSTANTLTHMTLHPSNEIYLSYMDYSMDCEYGGIDGSQMDGLEELVDDEVPVVDDDLLRIFGTGNSDDSCTDEEDIADNVMDLYVENCGYFQRLSDLRRPVLPETAEDNNMVSSKPTGKVKIEVSYKSTRGDFCL